MKTVEVGNNVKVHYVGTLTDGTEFDSSHARGETLAVEAGMAGLCPDFEVILGGTIQGNGPQGPFLAKIHALEEEAQRVLLDMNHPLAGEQLTFNMEMVEIAGMTTNTTTTTADSDYTSLNVTELKAMAKQRGLKGYSTLKKAELIALLDN